MNKQILDQLFHTTNRKWDNQIAYSIKDIAEMLDLPKSTVAKLCQQNTIKTFKVGRHYRVTRQSLYDYIANQEDQQLII